MSEQISRMAQEFNVDPGALASMLGFLQENIAKDPAVFINASDAQRDAIIKQGVIAWRDRSVRMLSELQEGKSEWAMAAREKIASDVWHQVRAQQAH